jgi:hypothetical protein
LLCCCRKHALQCTQAEAAAARLQPRNNLAHALLLLLLLLGLLLLLLLGLQQLLQLRRLHCKVCEHFGINTNCLSKRILELLCS